MTFDEHTEMAFGLIFGSSVPQRKPHCEDCDEVYERSIDAMSETELTDLMYRFYRGDKDYKFLREALGEIDQADRVLEAIRHGDECELGRLLMLELKAYARSVMENP